MSSKLLSSALTMFLCFSGALVAAPSYYPQTMECAVTYKEGRKINSVDCPALPYGSHINGTVSDGQLLTPGLYRFAFSFATAYTTSSQAPVPVYYYVADVKAAEMGKVLMFDLVNTQHQVSLEGVGNQWQLSDDRYLKGYYCYARGVFYSKVNAVSGCPFQ